MLQKLRAVQAIHTWYHIILSATLYNVAFVFMHSYGFMVIASIVLLCTAFVSSYKNNISPIAWIFYGFVWGALVYGGHFYWFLYLMLTHGNTTITHAFTLYSILVFYGALTSAVWFFVIYSLLKVICSIRTWFIIRILCLLSMLAAYFTWVYNYFCWFFPKQVGGYPFIMPYLPLAQYAWCAWIISSLSFCLGPAHKTTSTVSERKQLLLKQCSFVYCPPVAIKKTNKRAQASACTMTFIQKQYHLLTRFVGPDVCENNKKTIVVSPESSCPFDCSQLPSCLALWNTALTHEVKWLFGSCRIKNKKQHQSAFLFSRSRIMHSYDKSILIPGFETFATRPFLNWLQINQLFITENKQLSSGSRGGDKNLLECSANINAQIQICADLFYAAPVSCKANCVISLVNDSWFLNYFKQILRAQALTRSFWLQKPIVYVTSERCDILG